MFGGAGVIEGAALGTAGAVAGIGIAAMGTGMIANQIGHITEDAKKTIKEKG